MRLCSSGWVLFSPAGYFGRLDVYFPVEKLGECSSHLRSSSLAAARNTAWFSVTCVEAPLTPRTSVYAYSDMHATEWAAVPPACGGMHMLLQVSSLTAGSTRTERGTQTSRSVVDPGIAVYRAGAFVADFPPACRQGGDGWQSYQCHSALLKQHATSAHTRIRFACQRYACPLLSLQSVCAANLHPLHMPGSGMH